ncbi:MAG: hypothetical protein U9Q06_03055 [Nanoarchaeota archaeon]|nr:hypothetical protein [Nanoarchaeota archaeon]
MAIKVDKIFGDISFSDYCESVGKSVEEYKLIGMHKSGKLNLASGRISPAEQFARSVPDGVEAVVKYDIRLGEEFEEGKSCGIYIAQGIALIPR